MPVPHLRIRPAKSYHLYEAPMIYCDVSLPVPLDQSFTYRLPETLRHRVKPGCRVLVPFGARKLTGVVVKTYDEAPDGPLKDVLRLIDEEPVLDTELISLARWISQYYCAPLGEVLRSMTPLTGEIRKTKVYSLTDAGRTVILRSEEHTSDSSHVSISYAVFCLKKKKKQPPQRPPAKRHPHRRPLSHAPARRGHQPLPRTCDANSDPPEPS